MPTTPTVRAAALRDLRPELADPVARTALWARAALDAGLLDLPLPGRGATGERFAALADLGGADLDLARLAEAHVDAVAIRADLGAGGPADGLWGVWAANPPADPLLARRSDGGWRLDGTKPWCSGAGCCDRALVTARTDDGYRLFAVDLADPRAAAVDGTWPAAAMQGSDSRSVRFDGAPADAVGGPQEYLERPGFWHGAVGVAAVWWGGAREIGAGPGAGRRSPAAGPARAGPRRRGRRRPDRGRCRARGGGAVLRRRPGGPGRDGPADRRAGPRGGRAERRRGGRADRPGARRGAARPRRRPRPPGRGPRALPAAEPRRVATSRSSAAPASTPAARPGRTAGHDGDRAVGRHRRDACGARWPAPAGWPELDLAALADRAGRGARCAPRRRGARRRRAAGPAGRPRRRPAAGLGHRRRGLPPRLDRTCRRPAAEPSAGPSRPWRAERLGLAAAPRRHLGLRDGRLAGDEDRLTDLVAAEVAGADVVLAPWSGDGHPDHEACGRAARAGLAAAVLEYPVWAWHWAEPDDARVPWSRARRVDLDADAAARKAAAVGCFRTQVGRDRSGGRGRRGAAGPRARALPPRPRGRARRGGPA